MKRTRHEPERWSERAGAAADGRQGAPVEDELGALFRRLRQATAATAAATTDIWAEPPRAARAARATGRQGARLAWRLVLAAAGVVATGGAVSAARVIWRSMAAPEQTQQTLTIPSGSTVTVTGRSRRRLTVTGPARLDLARADADELDVKLAGGMLVAEAGDEPLRLRSEALLVTVPPGGLGQLDGRNGGGQSVNALAGELRVASASGGERVTVPVGHRWPERVPAAPPEPSPVRPAPLSPASSSVPVAPALAAAAGPPAPASTGGGETASAPSRSRGDEAAPPGETRRLAQAFHALRVDGDAAAALAALDRYAQRFPNGTLAPEARIARVEALLALGRTGDALSLLLAMRERDTGLTRDVQITRAELLAEKDRCPEAMPDFDDLVQANVRDAVGERALYGRAACHLRAGRTAAARQDLDRYLSVYPGGRFAGAAQRAADDLGTLPPASP
jgi:TolA-binding protein